MKKTSCGQVSRRAALWQSLALAGCVAALSGAVMAQPAAWPVQTLKLVVGFPAGSSPDLTARTLAEPLSQALGQPVIVENKPGAGGNIGAAAVAQARDGHTLGLMINGNLTTAKLLNPATPYDPHQDLAPVSLIATAPLVLTAAQPLPAQGTALFSAGQQAGAAWSYGSPGIGTVAHLGMELLKTRTGWAAVHVPYPGNPQVINGLLAGQIQVALLPPGLVMAQAKAGKLHAVGLTSAGRSALVPEVPSLAEAGLSGFQLEIWNAVAAPKTMPDAHIQKVANALTDIVRRPEMRQKLLNQGWQVAGTAPEGLALRIKADTAHMSHIIQKQQLKAQ
jgi:tripartite-type tricarboxylate transporter receptor subunit TctC